jgi:hypothetical protein
VRFQRGTIIVLLALCVPHGAGAQNWQWAISERLTRERVTGLLNLPDIVGTDCAPSHSGKAALYASPSTGNLPIGSIERARNDECQILARVGDRREEQLPTDESAYELPAAIVFQRAGSWFRIALQRGSAWVRRDEPRDFLSYPQLLKNRLAYVRDGWGARLWETPGATVTARLPSKWKSYARQSVPMTFLGFRRVAGKVWIHVRLETESCGEPLEGVKALAGWIPAYRPNGEPSVWFYARGC